MESISCEKFIEELLIETQDILKKSCTLNLLISGGSSVHLVTDLLKTLEPEVQKKIRIIISDERWVPLSSEESNTGAILSKLGPNEYAILSPYEGEEINAKSAMIKYDAIKEVDIAILGVGEDGHVASLFSTNEEGSESLVVVENAPKPPVKRISITFEYLKRCLKGYVLIIGKNKKHLLEQERLNLPYQKLLKDFNFTVCTDQN